MARAPDHRAERARDMFLTGKKLVDIANELGVPDSTVRRWKHTYKWEGERSEKKSERSEQKANARKEEKKVVADEVIQVVDNPDLTDMQRLFCILYVRCFNATKAAIKAGYSRNSAMEQGYQLLRNPSVRDEIARLKQHRLNQAMLDEADIFQKYMDIAFSDITDYVEFGREEVQVMGAFGPVQVDDPETGGKKTLTKEINSVRFRESNAVDGTLITEVKQGKDGASIKLADRMRALDWLAEHMDLATAEQRAKIEHLRAQIESLQPDTDNNQPVKYTGIPSTMVAPVFAPVVFDIQEHRHTEYVFPGGRGSTKSSFISMEVIDLIMSHEDMHAVVMRQVADTLRSSVYQQILWAIEALNLTDEFRATVSPMEITRISTGQKIYFRGADDPGKVKSVKVPFGYIGILWLEELDQFVGPESVRKIEQSVIRGGDVAYIFKSFNPPKSASNWANKYIKIPKDSRLVTESTYLDVPQKWL